jgi:hypothetical protein
MPVIKVWCLPQMEEGKLSDLAPSNCWCGQWRQRTRTFRDENDMTTLFPSDLMKYGLGTDIIVEITGLDDKPERTHDVLKRLAKNTGEAVSSFFPDAKVECFVHPFNHNQKGFWSTH